MKLLLPVDGSDHSIQAARFLAPRLPHWTVDGGLHVLHVGHPVTPRAAQLAGRELVEAFHREETERATHTVRQILDAAGVPYRPAQRTGLPGREIAAHATEAGIDLVVMGTHGNGAFHNLLLGSTAQATLASCDVPVLLVRPEAPVSSGPVLLAVDGSPQAMRAADFLAAHPRLSTARTVLLVHVAPGLPAGMPAALLERAREVLHDEADATFEEAVAEPRRRLEDAGLACETRQAVGDPAIEIVRIAEQEGCELVTMGTHGRGAMGSVLLGSVAQKVVAATHVPVLLVR